MDRTNKIVVSELVVNVMMFIWGWDFGGSQHSDWTPHITCVISLVQ
jgi:hypothetical protein